VHEIVSIYLTHVRRTHAAYGYERDFHALARHLRIIVHPGPWNSAVSGPPPRITIAYEEYGSRRRFTSYHELAHILMQQIGIEDALVDYHGTYEEAEWDVEALCNLGASLLLMPDPMVEEALRLYGATPRALQHLREQAHASYSAALRRLVHHDPNASRAGFIATGRRVMDIARNHFALPFRTYDRLPDVFPSLSAEAGLVRVNVEETEANLLVIPGSRKCIGMFAT